MGFICFHHVFIKFNSISVIVYSALWLLYIGWFICVRSLKVMCDQTNFCCGTKSYETNISVSPSLAGPSCLRNSDRKQSGITRNVSFPDDDNQIVTGILEPENPWKCVSDITNEDLISRYVSSCKKHGTYPIPAVLDQLSKFELKIERNKLFSLKGVLLNPIICETLEEVLKHIQFYQINLESTALNDEASVALFDMLEYYESATHLNISSNQNIGVRGWQACARMIKKTCCLEELEARNTTLNEIFMPILGRALKVGSQLQILKLENCNLSGRPLIILASALKVNNNLKELYLSENNFDMSDANQLGSMLRYNTTLQLLDISHNDIKDVGFNYIINSIIEKCFGLSVLMVWNNQLTKNIAYTAVRLLEVHTSLETLNIGQNALSDEFLRIIKEPLIKNKNILRLGLQSTSLSNEAAFILSDILKTNNLIQRIDLRDNNILISGLASLLDCLMHNKNITRLDLDKLPRKCAFTETTVTEYKSLVDKIRKRCAENEKTVLERKNVANGNNTEEKDSVHELNAKYHNLKLSVIDSRKISLTCESLHFCPPEVATNNFLGEPKKNGRLRSPAPSPIPSPVSSPSPVRSRFQVSKVKENQNSCPFYIPATNKNSRFKVTIVEPEAEPLCNSNCTTNFNKNVEEDEKNYVKKNNIIEDINHKTPSVEVTKIKEGDMSEKVSSRKDGSNPITERIRKLSWVSPILQAPSMAIESAKIPENLEKLIGLFQNPFVRNQAKSSTEVVKISDEKKEIVYTNEQNEENNSCDTDKLKENFIRTLSDKIKCEVQTKNDQFNSSCNNTGSKSFPATWPQKLSSNFLPSTSKSSPNILEATAFVLLQGHVSSDLTGFQNISVNQPENTAGGQT